MVTSNDVDGKLNDFSHVKIHRHQTSIEITEKKKNDDEATNASSRYCRVLISKYICLIQSFVCSIEPLLKSLFLQMNNQLIREEKRTDSNTLLSTN